MSEDSVQYQKRRPIIPRVERARRALSWFLQAGFIENWTALPEFDPFIRAGRKLIGAIDKGGK
jgi:hypothetical protein